MRKLVIISFIILGVVYIGGAVCALFKVIDWNVYLIIAAIVGGLASILGLGAASMRSEIRDYSADALKQLAKTASEIENKRT